MKRILALLLSLCLLAHPAIANTTHYNVPLPVQGGSPNTWGTIVNSAFVSFDTNTWNASFGTAVGVNAPSASGSNITLTAPINNVQNIAFTGTGKALILPAMNASSSVVPGGIFYVNNVGSFAFEIFANDGTTAVVTSLLPGASVSIQLLTNGTANGTFQVYGPFLTNAVSGPGSSTSGDVATFNGTTGNVIQDSGILYTNVAQLNVSESFTATQSVTPQSPTISGSTFTPVFATSNSTNITLVHASCPCTIANPSGTIVPGTDITIAVQQSASGSDTVSWGSYYKFSGATAPTLSTTATVVDLVPCHVWSSTDLLCGFVGNFTP